MDISQFENYVVVGVLGICLCVGLVIEKSLDFIPNKFAPLIMLILGTTINVIANWGNINISVVLSGMVSGLSATGIYETYKKFKDKK